MGDGALSGFLEGPREFGEACCFGGVSSPDDIFSILESLENVTDQFPPREARNNDDVNVVRPREGEQRTRLVSQRSASSSALQESETDLEASPQSNKRPKLISSTEEANGSNEDGLQRMSHITVERNRRKQMNEHLAVLRSLMPSFYVKRGDQASIIGGVVDYINELQQILQSLEAKKQRKVYSEVLSPRVQQQVSSSPRVPISPRIPPLSPRLPSLPISPRTPQHPPSSPYPKPPTTVASMLGYTSPSLPSPRTAESSSTSATAIDAANELVANSKSAMAEVEVKFCGANVVLKTASPRIPGQASRIVSALEELSLEILRVDINKVDETMLNSITIKIGIECQLSAEELALRIQQTFC